MFFLPCLVKDLLSPSTKLSPYFADSAYLNFAFIMALKNHLSVEESMTSLIPTPPQRYIRQLSLHNYRNYRKIQLQFGPQPVVFVGPNGAGKTNLLEALSLFAAGSGLRGAKLPHLGYQETSQDPSAPHSSWAAHILLEEDLSLATGLVGQRRLCKIQGEPVKSATVFHEYLHLLHVTPDMDHLFTAPSSERRKFIDQLIASYNPHHKNHLSLYEKATKQRLALLRKESSPNDTWLSSLEKIMADNNLLISQERTHLLHKLHAGREQLLPQFPPFEAYMEGPFEDFLHQHGPNDNKENLLEEIQHLLKRNRPLDAAAGMTFFGVHRSDLSVLHKIHQRPSFDCSTGEQKILLLSLLLAFIYQRSPQQPFLVLLLDDVIARLDLATRVILFEQIEQLNRPTGKGMFVQTFFSGTDWGLFSPLKTAQFFEVLQGTVTTTKGVTTHE